MSFDKNNLVTLSQFSECFDIVQTDCEFFCAGKVGSDIDNRVVYVQSVKYLKQAIELPDIVGLIVPHSMANDVPSHLGCALSEDPVASFWALHQLLADLKNHYWHEFDTTIPESCNIHPTAVIADKNVVIGERVQIGANSVIDERTIIEDDAFIGTLSHVGAPAFELFESEGKSVIPKQAGGVVIGNSATILSCTAIVKSCFPAFTVIGENVSVDNLVHIAHDCKVGKGSKVVATSILCGRVQTGENTYIGPNATVSNGVSVGDGGKVTLGSVVTRDVKEGQTVSGNFAREHREFLRSLKSK